MAVEFPRRRNREFFRSEQGISGKDQGSVEGGASKGASLQGTESRRPSAAACCGDRRLSGEEKRSSNSLLPILKSVLLSSLV